MPTSSMRAILDQLRRQADQERQALGLAAASSTARDRALNLRYRNGEEVVDLTTGLRGVIVFGDIDAATRYQRYRVALADARIVYRTERELEPSRG